MIPVLKLRRKCTRTLGQIRISDLSRFVRFHLTTLTPARPTSESLVLSVRETNQVASFSLIGWLLFMTVGTILSSFLSLIVLTAAPVISSTLTIITALFNLTVYDTAMAAAHGRGTGSDSEMPSCASPLLKIGVGVPYLLVFPGALQAVFATIRLVVVHPAAGTACLAWASLRFTLRCLRDSLTLYPQVLSHSRLRHLFGMAHPRPWAGSN